MSARAVYWVLRRELHEMFRAPLVYGIGGVFLFVQGVAFAGLVGQLSDPQRAAPLGALLEGQLAGTLLTWVLQLVVLTLLGMRAIADDKRTGAWELLLTAQVSERAAVVGKWLAASAMYALLWIPTLVYLGVVAMFRADSGGWDFGAIVVGYLGAIAIGVALLAWAIAASAATRSTLAAGALGFTWLVGSFLIGELPALWPELPAEHPTLAAVFEAISIRGTVLGFARGEISAGAVALLVGLAVTGLSAATWFACAGRRRRRELRLRGAGTAALAAIAILLGIHGARHPIALDVSAGARNTLDPATREVLASLPGDATLTIVLPTLGGLEPIYDEIGKVAQRMADAGPVTVRVVDPASAPGGIAAIAKTAGLARGDLAQGGAVVVDLGGRRRVVDLLGLVSLTRGPGDAPTVERLAVEQAITGALATLANRREYVACATTGHAELPMAGGAPAGADWSAVADRLRAEGFTLEEVGIDGGVPARCRVLIVAGPAVPLTPREALAIQDHVRAGRGLLVVASSRHLAGTAAPTGLEGVLASEGLGLPAAVAIDPALAVREVDGGLLVIDGYADHPINAGFARTRATLWFQPRAVIVDGGALPLVRTTAAGWGERDFQAAPEKNLDDLGGPVILAAIGKGGATGKTRVIAVGSIESFTTSLIAGGAPANDLWLARAVRWLAGASDRKVDIAERSVTQIRLVLTGAEKRAITLMCVVGIPLAWLLLGGGFVLWRMRRARRST